MSSIQSKGKGDSCHGIHRAMPSANFGEQSVALGLDLELLGDAIFMLGTLHTLSLHSTAAICCH
eukprot:5220123-Amphidinium_carterae.1